MDIDITICILYTVYTHCLHLLPLLLSIFWVNSSAAIRRRGWELATTTNPIFHQWNQLMVRPGYTILRAAMDAFDHLVPGKRLHPARCGSSISRGNLNFMNWWFVLLPRLVRHRCIPTLHACALVTFDIQDCRRYKGRRREGAKNSKLWNERLA